MTSGHRNKNLGQLYTSKEYATLGMLSNLLTLSYPIYEMEILT